MKVKCKQGNIVLVDPMYLGRKGSIVYKQNCSPMVLRFGNRNHQELFVI